MTLFREALDQVVASLDERGVPWAVTGSFALAAHGVVRATHDIDLKLLVERDDPSLGKIADGLRRSFRVIDETTFRYREALDIELYPVDGRIDEESFENRQPVRLFRDTEREYWIVSPEDLVLSKLREYQRTLDYLQVDDVKKLVLAQRAAIRWDYLEERLARYGFQDAWDRLVESKR